MATTSLHHGSNFSASTWNLKNIKEPHENDVLCGRGVATNKHPGNESFRSLVSLNRELYVTSRTRQKISISRSIVEAIRTLDPPGRFLEKNPNTLLWSDVGDKKAIEKTSQALRDVAVGLRKELSEESSDANTTSLPDNIKSKSTDSSSVRVNEKCIPAKVRKSAKFSRKAKTSLSKGKPSEGKNELITNQVCPSKPVASPASSIPPISTSGTTTYIGTPQQGTVGAAYIPNNTIPAQNMAFSRKYPSLGNGLDHHSKSTETPGNTMNMTNGHHGSAPLAPTHTISQDFASQAQPQLPYYLPTYTNLTHQNNQSSAYTVNPLQSYSTGFQSNK